MSTRRNLESAFARPAKRSDGMADILAPRKHAAPEAPKAQTPEPAQRNPARETPAEVPAEVGIVNVGIYLPPALLADVNDRQRRTGETYADLLLEAFDTIDLEVLRLDFRPTQSPSGGGMPRRPEVPKGSTGVQRQFRLTSEQRAWLDETRVAVGAPSRSALAVRALTRLLSAEPSSGDVNRSGFGGGSVA